MSPPSILLKNGTVLKHDGQDRVHALHNTDVLIADGRIADIGPNIKPPSGSTLELDCQHKIVSPGFVNAHHHLWQTALKGRFADATLIDYMISGAVSVCLADFSKARVGYDIGLTVPL